MLGGQILLPSNNSKASRRSHRSTSSSSSSKSSKAPKVQGDFASGGSGMVPSEPQSSAHSEVETENAIFEAFLHILANTTAWNLGIYLSYFERIEDVPTYKIFADTKNCNIPY